MSSDPGHEDSTEPDEELEDHQWVAPSPVVELNRAVAVSMAFGPQAGLDLVDALTAERTMHRYHLLPSVRGDLLVKLGRPVEARQAFERAATLTRNGRERGMLLERARLAAEQAVAVDQGSHRR